MCRMLFYVMYYVSYKNVSKHSLKKFYNIFVGKEIILFGERLVKGWKK